MKLLFLALAAAVTGYRSWTPLTPEPKQMSYAQSAMCMSPGPSQGPHADRWAMVYANRIATGAAKEFPVGSILVKEKRLKRDDAKPEGVAYMIKHGKGKFAKSGGWEFGYVPSGKQASTAHCVNCHKSSFATDYVFTSVTRSAGVPPAPAGRLARQ